MSDRDVSVFRFGGVTVDRSQVPSRLSFDPGFNVAIPFVDRHLAEGRSGKVAIRTTRRDVTYAELVADVNRCGNALLGAGLLRGERLLMIVKDCAEFFALFWGAIKAGIVPVPLNTILRAENYRGDHRRFGLRRDRVVARVRGRGRARPARGPEPTEAAPPARGSPGAAGERRSHAARGPGGGDRHLLLALFVGVDGATEGGGPPPPRHGRDERALRALRARGRRGGRPLLGREALLRVRARERAHVPALARGHLRAARRPTHGGEHPRDHRAVPPDPLLRRADALRGAAPGPRDGPSRISRRSGSASRRASRSPQTSSAAGRSGRASRSSTGSARPRPSTRSSATDPATSGPVRAAAPSRATRSGSSPPPGPTRAWASRVDCT